MAGVRGSPRMIHVRDTARYFLPSYCIVPWPSSLSFRHLHIDDVPRDTRYARTGQEIQNQEDLVVRRLRTPTFRPGLL